MIYLKSHCRKTNKHSSEHINNDSHYYSNKLKLAHFPIRSDFFFSNVLPAERHVIEFSHLKTIYSRSKVYFILHLLIKIIMALAYEVIVIHGYVFSNYYTTLMLFELPACFIPELVIWFWWQRADEGSSFFPSVWRRFFLMHSRLSCNNVMALE